MTSSGRGGTAAAMAQNEQMAEEHSTLDQQPPGRLDHPAWCVVWTLQYSSRRFDNFVSKPSGCTPGEKKNLA